MNTTVPPTNSVLPYKGHFTIELYPRTSITNLPPGTTAHRNIITVEKHGEVIETHRNVEFRVNGSPFSWARDRVKYVRDKKYTIIWANEREKNRPQYKPRADLNGHHKTRY